MDPAKEYEAAGLYDPDAPDAAARLALLEHLRQQGTSLEEMIAAQARDALHATASDRRIRPGRRMSIEEVAREVGISVDLLRTITVASGVVIPDDGYRDSDIEIFRLFAGAQNLFGEEALLQFTRVVGAAMARVAEAAVLLFIVNVEGPLKEQGAAPTEMAQAAELGVDSLSVVPSVMDGLFRLHVEAAIARQREAGRSEQGPGSFELAVGFVDLVGFTPLTADLDVEGLAKFVERFEARANEIVATGGGRVVKHIGDEVMFAAIDPAAACEIALRLVDEFGGGVGVEPHAGVGFGTVLARGGDYYGSVVNLASRIASIAVPGEVLVTSALHEAVGERASLRFEPAGRRQLKGFAEPVPLWSVTRAD